MNIKRKTSLAIVVAAVAASAIITTGCSRDGKGASQGTKAGAESAEEVASEPQDKLSSLFMEAESLYSGGSTNETIALLDEAIGNPDFANDKRQIFGMLIRVMLFSGMVEEASDRMLAAYVGDPDIAADAMGAIYFHHMETGDAKAAADWTARVLSTEGVADNVRRAMREWNLVSHIQLGDTDEILSLADSLLRDAPGGDAITILQRAIDMLFDRHQTQIVEKILSNGSKIVTSDEATRNLLLTSRLRLLAEQGAWDALARLLPSAAETLPDQELQRVFRRIVSAANVAKNPVVVDEMCALIITNFASKSTTAAFAARQWTDSAARSNLSALPDRIAVLLNKDFPAPLVAGIFQRYFYDVVDDPAMVREMKDIGERIAPKVQDDDTKGAVMTMVLDSCFILEDYDSALTLLRAGIYGYDSTWHEMAIAKVEAHKALAEKRPLDAIRHFRAFMAIVEVAKEGDAADPSTGVVHTREMILGRNAKRIGDIYRDMAGDATAASAAYAEARAYYGKALATKPDKEVADIIEAEMAAIPE